MCGIAGVFAGEAGVTSLAATVDAMSQRLLHRGPDDGGNWVDTVAGIALGHRRLAIIDTSTGGRQPMASPSGRYTIVYNGELYNFHEIRTVLQQAGVQFRTSSDTEVLLAAIETWGLRAALGRAVGMFALALWDSADQTLSLVRDRAGEKPLYYGRVGGNYAFASELKAFNAIPGFRAKIDPLALRQYLQRAYVPAPLSMIDGVGKLPPGHVARLSRTRPHGIKVELQPYWQLPPPTATTGVSYDDARMQAELLLANAVHSQMVSDVPLGAFLSGGIDSTAIVALMQEASPEPVRTFSIGSTESAYDEAQFASAVARQLGTQHTELYASAQEARAIVPDLARIYDEPFADSSQIPAVLVSRLARQHVTVALTGDAGDEVFGGYNRYSFAPRAWARVRFLPPPVRAVLGGALAAVPSATWDTLGRLGQRVGGIAEVRLLGEKVHKLARAMSALDQAEFYDRLASCWLRAPVRGHESSSVPSWFHIPEHLLLPDQFVNFMMHVDFLTYLTDDILVKVDRAAMSIGLESRVPLLDHRLVEFVGTLPIEYKLTARSTKRILRDIAYSRVPQEMLDRPKSGFGVPIDVWLRGPLREWAEQLLRPSVLQDDGLLDVAAIQRAWREHQAGYKLRHHELWAVLMFQAWRIEFNAFA